MLSRTQDPTRPSPLSHTGLSPCAAGDSTPFRYARRSYWWSYNPGGLPPRFGLVRVRSPLLTESRFLSLPPGTEMFQFPGLARALRDQSPFDGSPGLIAVFHALESPGAKTSPTRPYDLGRTAPTPRTANDQNPKDKSQVEPQDRPQGPDHSAKWQPDRCVRRPGFHRERWMIRLPKARNSSSNNPNPQSNRRMASQSKKPPADHPKARMSIRCYSHITRCQRSCDCTESAAIDRHQGGTEPTPYSVA